uniref:Uncharacterized protein n=1 Tax=Brassica oleracea TaxID=3712 RepID=A0A3P6E1P1_BRAOL|nr:unnamed protein product [Brassica oleracea]
MVDYLGFRILYSQFAPVYQLFKKHPDIAANFRQSNQFVRTAYMNLLLTEQAST